jgi:hypothetical protein
MTTELEAIDRMALNDYAPSLQTGTGFAYLRKRSCAFACHRRQ